MLGDSNRLDLQPIISLSRDLKQVVDVFTRLNPPSTLDTIITSLSKFYTKPITKPPIDSDKPGGKPSDHLIVLYQPLQLSSVPNTREYRTIEFRPLPESGISNYGYWLSQQNWSDFYKTENVNEKAVYLHQTLLNKFHEIFPLKQIKMSNDDKPWFTDKLKKLDRLRKREFFKRKKSPKWRILNKQFLEETQKAKENYRSNIVDDLKLSNPSNWYSKVKRMAGIGMGSGDDIHVEEIADLQNEEQANKIAQFFSSTRNQ